MTRRPALLTTAIPVRITPGERESVQQIAEREGSTQAIVIRRAIRREIERAAKAQGR